jgi:ribosomal protein L31
VTVNEELVGSNPYGIKVVEMGKCAQNWAGHYGPRFKGERVYVLIYEKERHWTSKFPVVQTRIGEPYHSLCSSGCGDKFHFLGTPLQHGYNFLADLDLPHTHIINHPFETELSYEHAFIGGSSLAIKRDAVKLLKVVIPRGLDLKRQYFIQVAVRDTPSVLLNFKYISKNEQDRIFSAKQERVEEFDGWKRFTFKLVSTVGEVKADVRSIIDIVSTRHPYFLGEIKFFEAGTDSKTAVACTIEASRDFLPTNNYYLNIVLRSTAHRRLLVIV